MYRWSAALLPEWLRLLSGGTGTEQWASTFDLIRSDLSQRLTGYLPITAIVRLKIASKRLPSCETDTTTSDHPEGRRLAGVTLPYTLPYASHPSPVIETLFRLQLSSPLSIIPTLP